MQTVTVEITLNAAFYKEKQADGTMSRHEMKRELKREIKDAINELDLASLLDLMVELPALTLTPKIVVSVES